MSRVATVLVVALCSGARCYPPQGPLVPEAPTPSMPKKEESVRRETLNGHRPPPQLSRLPDEVVLRVMEVGRSAFVQCFKRAVNADPTTVSFKVRIRIELDAKGSPSAGTHDAETPALGNCLLRAAYGLPFGAPGKPAVVDLPLIYRD